VQEGDNDGTWLILGCGLGEPDKLGNAEGIDDGNSEGSGEGAIEGTADIDGLSDGADDGSPVGLRLSEG